MGRPSLVSTELEVTGDRIASVRVGGTATRRLEGRRLV
jgi:predicted PhzF superfamily epimerase YddE/YHI9